MSEKNQKISREKRRELLGRLKSELVPTKSDLYRAGVLSWLQFLMRVASFYFIAKAVSTVFQGETVAIGQLLAILVVLNLLGYGFALLAKRLQGKPSQYARNQLKQRFFKVLEKNRGQFPDTTSMADIITVSSQGIDSLDIYYNHYLSTSLRTYFNSATVLLLVLWLYPMGALIFLIFLPLIPISIIAMQKRSKRIMQHYWSTYMDVGTLFLDDLNGMPTLYHYQADKTYEKTFFEKAEAFRQSTMELLRFQLESVGYMDGVMYLGIGVSGFMAVTQLAQGNLSLFQVLFFILIATEFFTPIREMGYGMHLVMMNTRMADRIYQFLDSVETAEDVEGQEFPANLSAIHFQNVAFGYDGQENQLW